MEECIYEIKKTKVEIFMNNFLDPSSYEYETDNEANVIMDVTMMNLMNNLLKVKTVFY